MTTSLERAFTATYKALADHIQKKNPGVLVRCSSTGVYVPILDYVLTGSYLLVDISTDRGNEDEACRFWTEWLEEHAAGKDPHVEVVHRLTGLGWAEIFLWLPDAETASVFREGKPSLGWLGAITIATIPPNAIEVELYGQQCWCWDNYRGPSIGYANAEGEFISASGQIREALEMAAAHFQALPSSCELSTEYARRNCLNHWWVDFVSPSNARCRVIMWRDAEWEVVCERL